MKMRRVILFYFPSERAAWGVGGGEGALPDFFFCSLFPVQQTTSGIGHRLCVCVCFLPIHSGHQVRWTYQPGSHRRNVTQDFSSTFFLSAVRALIFPARRMQPFLSLVDREVEFCVLLTILIVLHPLGIFCFFVFFVFFSEKNPVCRGRTHLPTCQRVTRYL